MNRTTGTLTAADLDKPCRIEWEGWTHTGSLEFANHQHRTYGDQRVTFIGLRAESGSRWLQHLPADHPIEVRETAP